MDAYVPKFEFFSSKLAFIITKLKAVTSHAIPPALFIPHSVFIRFQLNVLLKL